MELWSYGEVGVLTGEMVGDVFLPQTIHADGGWVKGVKLGLWHVLAGVKARGIPAWVKRVSRALPKVICPRKP